MNLESMFSRMTIDETKEALGHAIENLPEDDLVKLLDEYLSDEVKDALCALWVVEA